MASSSSTLWPVSTQRKRKLSHEDSGDESVIKYYFTLEKEEDDDAVAQGDTGSESIYTIQDKSTMIVCDTDSDWSESDIEFDVQSLDQNPIHPFMWDNNSSSSEESEAETVKLEDLPCQETDCAADSDTANTTDCDSGSRYPFSDPELSPADFWNCAQCNAKNNNPLFRYCEKCFKVRKEFFPARPKGHKKRKNETKNNSQCNVKFSDSESESSSHDADEMKDSSVSAIPSIPSSSQSTVTSKDSHIDSSSDGDESSSDSKVRNYVKQISISTDSGLSDVANDYQEENRNCNICLKNPKNAGFFHGGKVHVYCCYKCAKKVWLYFKKCPVCNRKVSCVVRLIFS